MERIERPYGGLSVRGLSYTPRGSSGPVIDGLSFDIDPGEFVLLAGPSGSGKTTLLRLLKPEPPVPGKRSGSVMLGGRDVLSLSAAEQAALIGLVSRDPESQIVTDTVPAELAFGPENLGYSKELAALRVAETASWFGLDGLLDRKTSTLSGGKKQLLSLAAAAVTRPSLLLLDEPTSGLDPVSADGFLSAVRRLNRELGITVVIAEHRLGSLMGDASRLLVLDRGRLIYDGCPEDGIGTVLSVPALAPEAPAASRLAAAVRKGRSGSTEKYPVTVAEGRAFLSGLRPAGPVTEDNGGAAKSVSRDSGAPALEMKDVRFRYGRDLPDVLNGFSLTLRIGESAALLGGNGSGKTTVLLTAAGILEPYSGSCRVFGRDPSAAAGRRKRDGADRIGILPQNVRLLFSGFSVREELAAAGVAGDDCPDRLRPLLDLCSYDLSAGESRLLGLAVVLARGPGLLLLDEPTCGLDGGARAELRERTAALAGAGVAVLTVTHDCEFAAESADRIVMMFDGRAAGSGTPGGFFSSADFYTTDIRRITAPFADGCVTLADAARAFVLPDGKGVSR